MRRYWFIFYRKQYQRTLSLALFQIVVDPACSRRYDQHNDLHSWILIDPEYLGIVINIKIMKYVPKYMKVW